MYYKPSMWRSRATVIEISGHELRFSLRTEVEFADRVSTTALTRCDVGWDQACWAFERWCHMDMQGARDLAHRLFIAGDLGIAVRQLSDQRLVSRLVQALEQGEIVCVMQADALSAPPPAKVKAEPEAEPAPPAAPKPQPPPPEKKPEKGIAQLFFDIHVGDMGESYILRGDGGYEKSLSGSAFKPEGKDHQRGDFTEVEPGQTYSLIHRVSSGVEFVLFEGKSYGEVTAKGKPKKRKPASKPKPAGRVKGMTDISKLTDEWRKPKLH